jgi:hypothetical protein
VNIVLDTATYGFIIYIWYEDGDIRPSLVKLNGELSAPSRFAGGYRKASSADIG